MRKQEPDIQTLQVSDVKEPLPNPVSKVSRKETRVIVKDDGEPVAALVSAQDLRRLNDLDHAWDERTSVIERFSKAFSDVPADEVEADVARVIEERRKRRASGAVRQLA